MQHNSLSSISPSFTSHSSNDLADIAARVVEEFRNQNGHEEDDDIYNFDYADHAYVSQDDEYVPLDGSEYIETLKVDEEDEEEEDKEFEFDVVCGQHNSSALEAPNQIFFNGEILPRYPLFDQNLLVRYMEEFDSKAVRHVRQPLGKLFIEEREQYSCSSSEADDLEGVAPETYCIWKPKDECIENCKKSNSTGNASKRWKFRDLLRRSNSDIERTGGKNTPVFVFRAETKKKAEMFKKSEKTAKVADEVTSSNNVYKEGDRTRSYLPYKRDLVGVFANVNGLSRNLHPF